MTIQEIEQSIKFLESYITFMKDDKHPHYDKVERQALETALSICRIHLCREINEPVGAESLKLGNPYFIVHSGNAELTGWREYLGTWKTDPSYLMFRGYEFYSSTIGNDITIYRFAPKGE